MTEKQIHDALEAMVRRIASRFSPEKIILFGSHARGDHRGDSDVDLLIVMRVEGSRRQKANEIDLALADRSLALDLVVVTPDQFERQKDAIGTIVNEAAREGTVLYDRAA
jgi:predicted nucleotidyltransferase